MTNFFLLKRFKMNNVYQGSTLKPHVQISFLSELPYMLVTSIGFNSHFPSSRRSMADGVSQILRMGKGKCGSHCAQGCTVRVRREGDPPHIHTSEHTHNAPPLPEALPRSADPTTVVLFLLSLRLPLFL